MGFVVRPLYVVWTKCASTAMGKEISSPVSIEFMIRLVDVARAVVVSKAVSQGDM